MKEKERKKKREKTEKSMNLQETRRVIVNIVRRLWLLWRSMNQTNFHVLSATTTPNDCSYWIRALRTVEHVKTMDSMVTSLYHCSMDMSMEPWIHDVTLMTDLLRMGNNRMPVWHSMNSNSRLQQRLYSARVAMMMNRAYSLVLLACRTTMDQMVMLTTMDKDRS
jgi:hypothetical protein